MKTIEVELRGRLTTEQYTSLENFFREYGTHKESQDREMYLLRGYPGYSNDFATRDIDIRLRNTNGSCEIMLKRKIGTGANDSREEVSLPLATQSLDTAKEIVKALGVREARWMHRTKDVYEYEGVEWSLVSAPPSDIRYFEAEVVVTDESNIDEAKSRVAAQAHTLGCTILDLEGSRALIAELNEKANKLVEL